MIRLYDLLPPFYHEEDAKLGYPLKRFLEPLQEALDKVYLDEQILRVLQDPHKTPAEFLHYIAASLDWEFITESESARRQEATEIVNFYDLKGTPYALQLLSRIVFRNWFQKLIEFFPGGPGSISRLRVAWENVNKTLRDLLLGQGDFAVPDWKKEQEERRGRAYDFSPEEPYWHYFVHLRVLPGELVPGQLRQALRTFFRKYERYHPAGRFCYLWVEAPSDERGLHGTAVLNELLGGFLLDTAWPLDEKNLDEPVDPIHPSLSWLFPMNLYRVDTGLTWDESWRLDEGELALHAVIELR